MATPFRPAVELLTQYAEYHRDRRNIATHFVGVPMIVFAVGVLLARPALQVGGVVVSLAWIAYALSAIWFVTRGELALGIATSVGVGLLMALAHVPAGGSVGLWLGWGLGAFVLGWVIQFVGHYYEGRKPAFADDLVGLLVAPLFVTLELLALAGFFRPLVARIEQKAGPTMLRDLAHPA
jgi:uncharacterized membrane protein YGL010W